MRESNRNVPIPPPPPGIWIFSPTNVQIPHPKSVESFKCAKFLKKSRSSPESRLKFRSIPPSRKTGTGPSHESRVGVHTEIALEASNMTHVIKLVWTISSQYRLQKQILIEDKRSSSLEYAMKNVKNKASKCFRTGIIHGTHLAHTCFKTCDKLTPSMKTSTGM